VIGPTGAVRVMVATKPVDFRKGAEGLAALVRETMMADPFSGAPPDVVRDFEECVERYKPKPRRMTSAVL
jgi:hypothetical protein